MATKKTEPKATTTKKPKKITAEYRGRQYDVLDQNEHCICLTDGNIHFWARATDVKVG